MCVPWYLTSVSSDAEEECAAAHVRSSVSSGPEHTAAQAYTVAQLAAA